MRLDEFYTTLWRNYTAVTPQAGRIYNAIATANGTVVNDHVAFRTLNNSPYDLAYLASVAERLGYRAFDEYRFDQKKLQAIAFIHDDERQPKLFISELLVNLLSEQSRILIEPLVAAIPPESLVHEQIFFAGTLWPAIRWKDYQALAQESEYAAWFSVMGYRANHFTVSVNHLAKTASLDEIIELVQSLGLRMNESGGLIKGNALVGLQQASTLADEMLYEFAEGEKHPIKTCYYEFALRYPLANGAVYQGFVADSADKIFESTHRAMQ